jgi:hypothetical protein
MYQALLVQGGPLPQITYPLPCIAKESSSAQNPYTAKSDALYACVLALSSNHFPSDGP